MTVAMVCVMCKKSKQKQYTYRKECTCCQTSYPKRIFLLHKICKVSIVLYTAITDEGIKQRGCQPIFLFVLPVPLRFCVVAFCALVFVICSHESPFGLKVNVECGWGRTGFISIAVSASMIGDFRGCGSRFRFWTRMPTKSPSWNITRLWRSRSWIFNSARESV